MPVVDLQTETLERRLERLVITFLKDNVSSSPAGGFRHMDEDSEPHGDYCVVSFIVSDPEPMGPGTGWKEMLGIAEYRRGDTVEEDGDDVDAKMFDARWSKISDALDCMAATDLREALSVNTMMGYPAFVDSEERDTEDSERVRRKPFLTVSGLIDPTT